MSNNDLISSRIDVIRQKLGNLTISELEKGGFEGEKRLLGNATISGWLEKDVLWSSDKLEKFLTHYRINREWWKTGKGEIFDKNGTAAINFDEAALNQEKLYKDLVEANSDYRLVPKTVLDGEYRMMLKDELQRIDRYIEDLKNSKIEVIQSKNEVINQLKNELSGLYKEIADLKSAMSMSTKNA